MSFFQRYSKVAIRKPLVKISPVFSECYTLIVLLEGDNFDLN